MNELYKRIKERREELGYSQEELAKKLKYKSRSSINKIEMGDTDIPQSKIKAFAEALQTTPSYLMGWDNDPKGIDPKSSEIFFDAAMKVANQFGYDLIGDKYFVSYEEFCYLNLYKELSKENQVRLTEYANLLLELQIRESEINSNVNSSKKKNDIK